MVLRRVVRRSPAGASADANSTYLDEYHISTCLSNTYKDRYSLVVEETECLYSVTLRVDLGYDNERSAD